ncbi:MAG: ATP-binding protein [Alphaproteobacteria bacterium]
MITGLIFTYTFDNLYLHKTAKAQNKIFVRNNQYATVLYENFLLKKAIKSYYDNEEIERIPVIDAIMKKVNFEKNAEEFSEEQKRNNSSLISFNERTSVLIEAAKILGVSSIFILLSCLVLWCLMRKWVIKPIQKLSQASEMISNNNLSTRIETEKETRLYDEFAILNKTFNKMLDNLENNIKEITEKETFLQSLIDAIPDGVRVIDNDYNIIIANKEYYKHFEKCPSASKCYKSLQERDTCCDTSTYPCPVHEILKERKERSKIIKIINKKDKRYISINAAPLKISNNSEYVVESIRDLSDDIKFSYNQRLSSIGFLATSVAHEMKNNLGAVRMILEGIIDKTKSDKISKDENIEYMQMIHQQLIQSINIPERLLLFNENVQEDGIIDTVENINDVLAMLDYQAKSKGVWINFSPSQEQLHIKANNSEFRMIIINLLQNSLHAIKKQGQIKIEAFATKKNVMIKIKDSGKGIRKKDLRYIFDPFFSDGENDKEKGAGLGLTIVKSLSEKFKAEIKVYSKENTGTTFALSFPLRKKDLQN